MDNTTPNIELSYLEKVGKAALDSIGSLIPGIRSFDCSDPDYPSTAVILEVPGFCQVSTYTCGITSSWSIISALGYRISLKEWCRRCHKAGCHPYEGMNIDQIAKALKSLNLKVYTKRYRSKDQLIRLIDEGQPVLFGQGEDMFEDGDHWMYAYGYSARYVYVGNVVDPICSKEAWSWKRFEQEELTPKELYIINR